MRIVAPPRTTKLANSLLLGQQELLDQLASQLASQVILVHSELKLVQHWNQKAIFAFLYFASWLGQAKSQQEVARALLSA
jgi:hypothetical protein